MNNKCILEGLSFNPENDLKRIIKGFDNNEIVISPSGLQPHTRWIKKSPVSYSNHEPVLAVSIGGSNTKIMLSGMKEDKMDVIRIETRNNPRSPINLYDYLDDVLLSVPEFKKHRAESICLSKGKKEVFRILNESTVFSEIHKPVPGRFDFVQGNLKDFVFEKNEYSPKLELTLVGTAAMVMFSVRKKSLLSVCLIITSMFSGLYTTVLFITVFQCSAIKVKSHFT